MNIFNNISNNKSKRNVFDMTHDRKLALKMGELVPVMCEEVIPGDSFQVSSELMIRMAPMVSPTMHMVNSSIHFFFVPNRIIWDEWEQFITGGEDGDDNSVMPYTEITNEYQNAFDKGTLADHLGMNFNFPLSNPVRVNTLPFRAYQTIYNEYYRDQNLIEKVNVGKDGGQDIDTSKSIQKRAWEKDYFTSALPNAQKGGEVRIPMGDTAPVEYKENNDSISKIYDDSGNSADGDLTSLTGDLRIGSSTQPLKGHIDNSDALEVDLSEATATSINDLRRANKLQEWLERNMRGGTRYIESMLSHFGVKSSDARLQRPEYLGGGKSPIVMSEVLQTSATEATGSKTPLAEMAGHGIGVGRSNRFKKYFEEHGYVIGILSVVPKTAYQQGLRKQFFRFDKLDYAWPEFANLGEQEVKNKEIYNDGDGEGTFGYQSRYADYKYIPSSVHGDFKDNLAYWHMGRIFDSKPALNESFVTADPTTRIFAVEDEDTMYCQVLNKVRVIRKLPVMGTPYL